MSNFVDIRAAIKTKLKALTGTGQPFAFVYQYHKIGVEGYPAATFEPSSVANQIETTSENLRTYAFDIVIQQEISTETRENAIDTLTELTDTVINAFDQDWTLGGTAHIVEAAPAEFGEIATEDGIIAYSKVTLKCKVLKDIS